MKRTIITLLACTVVLSLSAQFLTFSNYEKALEGTVKGGGTATMMFNGKIIETGDSGLRSQGSLICFGTMEN